MTQYDAMKPLLEAWDESGHACSMYLIDKYAYSKEDASEVINCYDDMETLPEMDHILTLLHYFPDAKLDKTREQIETSWPSFYLHTDKIEMKWACLDVYEAIQPNNDNARLFH